MTQQGKIDRVYKEIIKMEDRFRQLENDQRTHFEQYIDLIFTLAKCKTSGNVRLLLEQLNVSLFTNGTGEDFLTHLTNSIYTVFVGKNYLTQGLEEKIKKAEEARKRLVSLQICDLCQLESFYCDYEKQLMEIPMGEWSK